MNSNPTFDTLLTTFPVPADDAISYRPAIFWAMNDKLERPVLEAQLDGFAKCGYGGVMVHAWGGLPNAFMDDAWLDSVAEILAHAATLSLDVWIWDDWLFGSGTDNIENAACTKRGIIVAHTPEDPTEPASDHFIAMLFAAGRAVPIQDRLVRRGTWDQVAVLPIAHFARADLGVIGFGRIGKRIVQKLSGFKMNVRVHDPYVDAETIAEAEAEKVELTELLKASQFVLVCCPLIEETRGLIGERELRMMRDDAILVNCARAGIVDEKIMVRALKEGWIRAAAVDFIEKTPIDPDGELASLDNLVVTPHSAGVPKTYPDGIFASSVDVIIGMSRKQRPKWIVNKDVEPWWDLTESPEPKTSLIT